MSSSSSTASGRPRAGRSSCAAVALVLVSALAPAASAAAHDDDHALYLDGVLGATVHREGLVLDLRLRYRQRLYDHASEAFHDNYFGAGIVAQSAPVYVEPGVYVELAPASFARVTLQYQLVGYFGVFDSVRALTGCEGVSDLPASDPRCDFRSPPLSDPPSHADLGQRAMTELLLQAQLGPFVVYDFFDLERWWFPEAWAAGASYAYWYNEHWSVPQRRADTLLTSSGALLFEPWRTRDAHAWSLLVGAGSDLAYTVGLDYASHRVGPVALLRARSLWGLRDALASLYVQWYTHDRYLGGSGWPFLGLSAGASTGGLP